MFSYYPLILEKSKSMITKIIYPHDISYITFLQNICIKKTTNNDDKIYNYTDRRQDFIMLNKGKLNIELINKTIKTKYNLILDSNLLKYSNNDIILNEPVLLNIHSSVFYNIKPLEKSNFLFYSCNYINNQNNIEFNHYKINMDKNKLIKYDTKVYPYFNFKQYQQKLVV